jgi:aromatic-L-amino-acid decarboxylase
MSQDSLDPSDWGAFRRAAHELLDACVDQLENARERPWQQVPQEVKDGYTITGTAIGETELANRLTSDVLPYHTGNTHPRFFGWVHGTGLPSGLMSEMVAATMNSNCGGRNHGALHMERAVIDWSRGVFGFPDNSSGVLVAGTSQGTVIALSAARLRALGPEVRKTGNGANTLRAYCGAGAHNAMRKAMELLGLGAGNLIRIPDADGTLDLAALKDAIAADKAAGHTPFAIIGTAGSVDRGTFDDFNSLADITAAHGLWLHIDGAFGAWTRLADAPYRALTDGIDRADSIACDFHKWMYVPYDCGLILIRNEHEHRATFAARPSYLAPLDEGLASGDPWYCDYGIDLSRGNRALKVWSALQAYGPDGLGQAITANCHRASELGTIITRAERMSLLAPITSNLVLFTADDTLAPAAQSDLNRAVAQHLQMTGHTVFSTTDFAGITCLRAAITNHRATAEDMQIAIDGTAAARALHLSK